MTRSTMGTIRRSAVAILADGAHAVGALLLLGAVAPSAFSQVQSGGALLGTPATILVGAGTASTSGSLASNQLHRKTAGFLPYGASDAPDMPGDPVFTTSEMFGGGSGPPAFEVDAISLGMDVVTATKPGLGVSYVDFTVVGGWGALAYSVSSNTDGPPGGLIAQEKAGFGGAAADLFTFILPGSDVPLDLLDAYPVGVPQRALDATEMDLAGGGAAGDITSLDLTMQLYQAGSPAKPADPGPVVFFSVSHDSVFPPGGGPSLVPAAWFDCGLPSGATILKTRWTPDLADPMGGHWTAPRVHLSYEHLGLDPEDDIDALAVDRAQSLVLFSIRKTPTSTLAEQLQVASWPPDTTTCGGMAGNVQVGIFTIPASLTDDGAQPVAGRLGTTPLGDIDSVCEVDPGTQGGGLSLAFGTPISKATYFSNLSSAVLRDDDDPAGPTITLTVAHLPPPPTPPTVKVVEACALVPGIGVLPLFSLPLSALGGASTFQISLSTPVLGAMHYAVDVSFFWVVREIGGPAPKVSSPIVAIEI